MSTLQQIAAGLGVSLAAFFETGVEESKISYVRSSERPMAAFAHGTLEDLGAGLSTRAVEPFFVTLASHVGSGSDPIVHTGHEFVFCIRGRIVYTIDDHNYLLEAGDSLLFESHLSHRWQNVGDDVAQAILVLCPSDALNRPTERHFRQRLLPR